MVEWTPEIKFWITLLFANGFVYGVMVLAGEVILTLYAILMIGFCLWRLRLEIEKQGPKQS